MGGLWCHLLQTLHRLVSMLHHVAAAVLMGQPDQMQSRHAVSSAEGRQGLFKAVMYRAFVLGSRVCSTDNNNVGTKLHVERC